VLIIAEIDPARVLHSAVHAVLLSSSAL